MGSGDVLRQTNTTAFFDSELTNRSEQDSQPMISEFGNTTVSYGSNALRIDHR